METPAKQLKPTTVICDTQKRYISAYPLRTKHVFAAMAEFFDTTAELGSDSTETHIDNAAANKMTLASSPIPTERGSTKRRRVSYNIDRINRAMSSRGGSPVQRVSVGGKAPRRARPELNDLFDDVDMEDFGEYMASATRVSNRTLSDSSRTRGNDNDDDITLLSSSIPTERGSIKCRPVSHNVDRITRRMPSFLDSSPVQRLSTGGKSPRSEMDEDDLFGDDVDEQNDSATRLSTRTLSDPSHAFVDDNDSDMTPAPKSRPAE